MSRIQKTGLTLVALFFVVLFLHELRHFYHYGHLVPLGLHADVSITTSDDVLGVEGIAKIYRAKLTNYGILPSTIVVCDYRVAGAPDTAVNYVVERWDRQLGEWTFVPEWDFYGSRLFCRLVFEVTEEHLASRRLWPGQSIRVGESIPAQMGGDAITGHSLFQGKTIGQLTIAEEIRAWLQQDLASNKIPFAALTGAPTSL